MKKLIGILLFVVLLFVIGCFPQENDKEDNKTIIIFADGTIGWTYALDE